jgi:adenylate cyclase
MRITIGNKVFGIAAAMTLIVAITATVSAYIVSNVNDDVRRVAETYIPLSNVIEDIERHALEQEILFERLIPRLRAGEGTKQITPIMRSYRARGLDVQTELQSGLWHLDRAQLEEHFVAFKVELSRLSTLLHEVVRVQEELENQTTTIFDRLAAGQNARINDLSARRLKLDEELEREINVITNEVKTLTMDAAAHAAEGEVWALRANIVSTISAALLGLILAGLIARNLVRPIHSLEGAARELQRGNLSPQINVSSNDEIGNLARAFEEMATELRVKEQIMDTFGKYVDPRVVENLTNGEDSGLGDGERRVYSVFFSDIAGFTGISEKLTPKALVNLINAYLSEMSEPIQNSQGVIDKYIGDAIMAYWGPPFTPAEEHAQAACRTALEQQKRLAKFRLRVGEITGLRRDAPEIYMRIGVATGEVLVGSVGSDTVRNYTVIGDTVNLSARLESLCKHYGTNILIDESTWQACGDDFETREIDTIAVAGKTEAVRIFELMAAKGDLTPERLAQRGHFDTALEHYRTGDWLAAHRELEEFVTQDATDGPAQILLQRMKDQSGEPPSDWDGVWRFSQK